MRNYTSSSFTNNEVLIVEIWEEISSTKHFHHDVDVVLVLKHVIEFDDVRVLTYF